MNNVPAPLLNRYEPPTFRFELEKSDGRVLGGSTNALEESELDGPLPPRPLRVAPGSFSEFEASPAPAESVESGLDALEELIAQLRDEMPCLRDEQ
jgi:oxalate decarboxylase